MPTAHPAVIDIDQRTLARALALDASTNGGVVDRLSQAEPVAGW